MRHFGTVFLCVLGLASSVKSLDNNDDLPPMDMPEGPVNEGQDADWLFEGDMKLTQSQLRQLNDSSSERNGLRGDNYRWPNAVIPYVINTTVFSSYEVSEIEAAFASFASNTCLRMVKRTTEADYIEFVRGNDGGCWSRLGRTGGKQLLSLDTKCQPDYENILQTIIIHELMHAAGFVHEQSRTDRDNYVRIAFENVMENSTSQFVMYSTSLIFTFGEPYDYQSIMHYRSHEFSKNGQKTIERLDGSDAELGNTVLSQIDINKLNKMYKCTGCVDFHVGCSKHKQRCTDWTIAMYCPKTCKKC